jgi:hypothetical protein
MESPEAIFAAALAATGAPQALANIQAIAATANCTGPNGPYTTEVLSSRDGRLRFTQAWPARPRFRAYVAGDAAWAEDAQTGALAPLDATSRAMVRSHEFQLLPLVLAERYRSPRLATNGGPGHGPYHIIEALDELGLPCRLLFEGESGLWAGMELTDPRERGRTTVLVEVLARRSVGGALLPERVRATDAAGPFVLNFHTIAINAARPTEFAPPQPSAPQD